MINEKYLDSLNIKNYIFLQNKELIENLEKFKNKLGNIG